jgi:HAD superfamily hydrolase (TIGR01549 family)
MNVKTEAFAQMFESFGENIVNKVVKHHVEHGGISRYVKLKHYYSDFLKQPLTEEKLNDLAQQFSDIVVEKVIESPWVKGAKEFLEKYYQKIDCYVISGTPQDELRKIVKARNMDKYFKGVYGSPDTKPVLAGRIISEHSYDPNMVVYIGDSLSDYKNAIEAKIPFLGRIPDGDVSPFPNDVTSIRDFFEIIK